MLNRGDGMMMESVSLYKALLVPPIFNDIHARLTAGRTLHSVAVPPSDKGGPLPHAREIRPFDFFSSFCLDRVTVLRFCTKQLARLSALKQLLTTSILREELQMKPLLVFAVVLLPVVFQEALAGKCFG